MKKKISVLLSFILLFSLAACGSDNNIDMVSKLGLTAETKDATEYTVQVNSALYSTLDFENKTEYKRGSVIALKVYQNHRKTAVKAKQNQICGMYLYLKTILRHYLK